MRQLVDVLVDVHDLDPTTARGVRPFAVYSQSPYALPKWVTKPAVWERAIEIFHGPVLDDDRTFIHRNFFPGNVLWHRRNVSGPVDWESASVGPRSMDVAHCRINLLYEGLDTADIFTRTWEQRTGRTFHRWADIATIIGLLATERRHPNGTTSRRCSSKPSTRSTARDQRTERAPPPAQNARTAAENSPPSRRSAPRATIPKCRRWARITFQPYVTTARPGTALSIALQPARA